MRLKEVTKSRNFYTLYKKKEYTCEQLIRQRSLGSGWLISEEVTRLLYTVFAALFPPLVIRTPSSYRQGAFTWEIYFLLSGGHRTVRVSLHQLPFMSF